MNTNGGAKNDFFRNSEERKIISSSENEEYFERRTIELIATEIDNSGLRGLENGRGTRRNEGQVEESGFVYGVENKAREASKN